jgi:uncharacterized membrane protein YkgB
MSINTLHAGALHPLQAHPPALIRTAGQMAIMRYGLVLVLLWIGGMKFTAYEAEGIRGFVANSPLLGWAYSLLSVHSFSAVRGMPEILTAVE